MDQLTLLRECSFKPVEMLLKECKRNQFIHQNNAHLRLNHNKFNKFNDNNGIISGNISDHDGIIGGEDNHHIAVSQVTCYLFAIQHETMHINKTPTLVHRIFVYGPDYPDYIRVGWLLHGEIEACLICHTEFGFFVHKHTCWACGNLVCIKCCPEVRVVEEISLVGPKRVCVQCCFGQEIVNAVPSYRDPELESQSLSHQHHVIATESMGRESLLALEEQQRIEEEEERLRLLRIEQEEEFRLAALERLKIDVGNDAQVQPQSLQTSDIVHVRKTSLLVPSPEITSPSLSSSSTKASSPQPPGNSDTAKFVAVLPTPGFVLKTWLLVDSTKVFIHVCSHEMIAQGTSSTQDASQYIIAPNRHEIRQGSGVESSIAKSFDCFLNPMVLERVLDDESYRAEICQRVLLTVEAVHSVKLNSTWKQLRVAKKHMYVADEMPISYIPRVIDDVSNCEALSRAALVLNTNNPPTSVTILPPLSDTAGQSSEELHAISNSGENSSLLTNRSTTVTLTPNPGFVVKTIDKHHNKVFINVLYDNAVPSYAPTSSTLSSLLARKVPFFAMGPTTTINEKDEVFYTLIVVVVSKEIYFGLDKDNGIKMPITAKFAQQLIAFLNESRFGNDELSKEQVSYPRTKLGFKGDEALVKYVITTLPLSSSPAATSGTAGIINKRRSGSEGGSSNSSSTETIARLIGISNGGYNSPLASTLTRTDSHQSAGSGNGSARFSLSATNPESLLASSSITMYLIPQLTLAEAVQQTTVVKSSDVVALTAGIIRPECGFVIEASQSNSMVFYVNVCHGNVPRTQGENSKYVDCVLGPMGRLILEGSKPKSIMDIVIGTEEYIQCLQDASGEYREELAVKLLQFLAEYDIPLSGDFALPNIPAGYLEPTDIFGTCRCYATESISTAHKSGSSRRSSLSGFISAPRLSTIALQSTADTPFPSDIEESTCDLLPTRNPPLVFSINFRCACDAKTQQLPIFKGDLWKKGHGVPYAWQIRSFQLVGRFLKYYDKGIQKGEFDIKNCVLCLFEAPESGTPPGSFQFRVRSTQVKDYVMDLSAASEADRTGWMHIINVASQQLAVWRTLLACPSKKTGFLKKKGHLIANWKNRYFILESGVLKYFDKQPPSEATSTVLDSLCKGSLSLARCRFAAGTDNKLVISGGEDGKDLEVQADSQQTLVSWKTAFEKHCKYITTSTML